VIAAAAASHRIQVTARLQGRVISIKVTLTSAEEGRNKKYVQYKMARDAAHDAIRRCKERSEIQPAEDHGPEGEEEDVAHARADAGVGGVVVPVVFGCYPCANAHLWNSEETGTTSVPVKSRDRGRGGITSIVAKNTRKPKAIG
jgi:hypothetical protein